jgi:hypothetical protein
MAGLGSIRRKAATPPLAPSRRRRSVARCLTALALLAVCLQSQRLTADEFPSPLFVEPSTPPDAFPLRAAEPPLWPRMSGWSMLPAWSTLSGGQPRLVAIDDEPASDDSSSHSAWSILGRWEAAIWRPERPTLVLTSYEGPATQPRDEVPPTPAQENSPGLVTLEGCTPPPITFRDDAWAFLPRVAHDAWGVVNNWDNLIILGTALGGSLALRGNVDASVRNWTGEHPDRWGEGSKLIGDIGVVQYQLPVIFGVYAFTVWHQDDYEHQMMTSLISAYTIFGVSTLAIKGIADTSRPSDTWNGGKYGFPSWHDGSMFAMSAVIDDYEGHWIGVPLYILSGLVGFSRIDTRDHDLSDVIFGGVLGYVIGKSVSGRALYGDSRVHILPYIHPGEGAGVMLDTSF